MARETKYIISVINITIQPHSPEMYISLFRDALDITRPILQHYRGNERIGFKITNFNDNCETPYIQGNVFKCTQISEENWYNADAGVPTEGDEDKPDIDISVMYPNYIETDFCFLPNGHRLFIVTEHKKSKFSIINIAKALNAIFNNDEIVSKYGKVCVTVEADLSAIDTILEMDVISSLTIKINLSNDDDLSPYEKEFERKLRKMNARTSEEHFTAEKGTTLKPDEETKAHMTLAISNGSVSAKGIENNKQVVRKSIDMPRKFQEKYDSKDIFSFDKLFNKAKSYLPFFTSRNNV